MWDKPVVISNEDISNILHVLHIRIIQYVHENGPLKQTTTVLQHASKGLYMNTREQFCV
jgi:hypothetical protein